MNCHARPLLVPALAAVLALALAACSAPPPAGFYSSPFERRPDAATLTELGRALFSDPALSASGRLSCASCHDPAHAYGPPDGRAAQPGGADLRQPGLRAVPSLRYAQDTPPFSEHYQDSEGADSEDQGPTGGRGWDGRAASAHEQASLPLLSPFEMANAGREAVLRGLQGSANAQRFRAAFGEHVFEHPALAWNGLLMALETFQQSPPDFYPYSSKYDAVLRGRATLSPSEARGLALFDDERRGGCARCHPSALRHGALPQFSDRGYAALGAPRNPEIAANADPLWRDQGLCGPLRTDLSEHPEYCGLFKTPTLRNVATRRVFFHNGVFHRLEDVLDFYARRDLEPARFGPPDLAPAARANLDQGTPFRGPRPGAPAYSEAEAADLIAFLHTLDDGWTPP